MNGGSGASGPRSMLAVRIGANAALVAAALVMTYEGYRARVYNDPIGRLAVCYGHDDKKLKKGQQFTKAECEALLDVDLLLHADVLNCVTEPAIEKLTDGQKAALVSFAFNVGVDRACASTFVQRINAGEGQAACAELSRWVYAGGKVLPGLVARRKAERSVCEEIPDAETTPQHSTASPVALPPEGAPAALGRPGGDGVTS
ncbi:MAG: lysozyme [Desulfovibrionaceae bacterium]|jgi:lysozyme|nr:lysozyme [Desulfovibrionaceae bacterium]